MYCNNFYDAHYYKPGTDGGPADATVDDGGSD
jgi:hypothetical protein